MKDEKHFYVNLDVNYFFIYRRIVAVGCVKKFNNIREKYLQFVDITVRATIRVTKAKKNIF